MNNIRIVKDDELNNLVKLGSLKYGTFFELNNNIYLKLANNEVYDFKNKEMYIMHFNFDVIICKNIEIKYNI